METLLKQLRELPARLQALPAGLRLALGVGVVVAVGGAIAIGTLGRDTSEYHYVFTNMTQEDSSEALGALKNANIPARVEANGTAIAVPADQVFTARQMLATMGLPRASGVGFDLFSQTDIGVSEFTQRVNLRRAIEGELARTIGSFQGVRSARVTVSLAERGLYKDEDKKASGAVVVNLQPGRVLSERELQGIRHLVSAATSGLSSDQVTVLDGTGAVLSGESTWDAPEMAYQRKEEKAYEQKVLGVLEPVVGPGNVVARVTASFDMSVVNQVAEQVDPDTVVLKQENTTTSDQSNSTTSPSAVAGAAMNVPLQPQGANQGPTQQGSARTSSNNKAWEFNKTTTNTASKLPKLTQLSVAIVVNGRDGKPLPPEDVLRLGELARKAVNYTEARGDQFEISSELFGKLPEVPEPAKVTPPTPITTWVAIGVGVLLAALVAFALLRRNKAEKPVAQELVLQPGSTVAALEAKQNAIDGVAVEAKKPDQPVLVDPLADLKDKARALLREDPERAVMLVRAWLSADLEKQVIPEAHHG